VGEDASNESAGIQGAASQSGAPTDAAVPCGKLLKRTQAARILGVSKSTLRRMEGDALTPVVGPGNVHLFHQEQIHSMVVTRRSAVGTRANGDVAADAFELFDDGVHPVDVVKKLRIGPEVIENLHQHWCRLRGLVTLTEAGTAALHRMLCDQEAARQPMNEAELLAEVKKWVTEVSTRHCEQCRREHATFCRTCARTWGLRAARLQTAEKAARRL